MRKSIIIIVILMLVSGCATYPETETFICKSSTYLDAGNTPSKIVDEFHAEKGYITYSKRDMRIDVTDEMLERIETQFGGDREKMIKNLVAFSENGPTQNTSHYQISDKGDYFEVFRETYSEERPKGWRGWIIPEDYDLEQTKQLFARHNICNE